MATVTTTQAQVNAQSLLSIRPKPTRVCFSVAAYAKNVIKHLAACNVPIQEGLSDSEFSTIEASLGFTFPPDLRSILQEGLPVGPGFPNWRSSSHQQLEILTSLPILEVCKAVSMGKFWCKSWGDEPVDSDEALALARRFLKKAPVLVPIYRHCYIPSNPNLAGNPVFFVHGGHVRMWSLDMAEFFQKGEFFRLETEVSAPAWAATTARRIEFWTEAVERARGGTRGVVERGTGLLHGGAVLEVERWRVERGGGEGDDDDGRPRSKRQKSCRFERQQGRGVARACTVPPDATCGLEHRRCCGLSRFSNPAYSTGR
ncbi:hypothetical protein CK203_093569 [Vitis vinifera]|uniref:Knr4/Smi1-like domain-containing protein n=1 Tax=Vitis vinifera TaxID=29760 RepID=A0A438C3S9_VITVI|nr:hypothetical protein CK203_093569 [Vitis vinifera]